MSLSTLFVSFAAITLFWGTIFLLFLTDSFAETAHSCNLHIFLHLSLTDCIHITIKNMFAWNTALIFTISKFTCYENTVITFHTTCLMCKIVECQLTFLVDNIHVICWNTNSSTLLVTPWISYGHPVRIKRAGSLFEFQLSITLTVIWIYPGPLLILTTECRWKSL